MSSDNAQLQEEVTPARRLEWQSELDASLNDIDSRLRHPRRRATDGERQPTLPELGEVRLTNELLDEIAWRVAEQIRQHPPVIIQAAPASLETDFPSEEPASGLKPGKMLMIRFQMPLLPWPLRLLQRRRRRHPLTTLRASV
jgi:hypothetical protein